MRLNFAERSAAGTDSIDILINEKSEEELEFAIAQRKAELAEEAAFSERNILRFLTEAALSAGNAEKAADSLLERFKNLKGILNAGYDKLLETDNVNENAAVLLEFMQQLAMIYGDTVEEINEVTGTAVLARIFQPYFMGEDTEKFLIGCFDGDLKLISVCEIGTGTSFCSFANLRDIISEALSKGCEMAALSHNHPGGSPKPSDEDISITRQINEILSSMGIRLMDHIVIGADISYSMRDGGELGIFD